MIDVYAHLARTHDALAQSRALLKKARSRFRKDRTEFAHDLTSRKESVDLLRRLAERVPVEPRWPDAPEDTAKNGTTDSAHDALMVEVQAHRLLRTHGAAAVRLARESAEIADELNDLLSAEVWRDIADEVERILGRS